MLHSWESKFGLFWTKFEYTLLGLTFKVILKTYLITLNFMS